MSANPIKRFIRSLVSRKPLNHKRQPEYSIFTSFTAKRNNIVLYGPPRQGKTTLAVAESPRGTVFIECQSEFKRPQIYRIFLSQIGYAVERESNRTATVQIMGRARSPFADLSSSRKSSIESRLMQITVDLGNPSEVAHLISRLEDAPYVILNNFHLLDKGTKRNLLRDISFFHDVSKVRFIIVGSWSDPYYLDRFQARASELFSSISFDFWSEDQLRQCLNDLSDRTEESDLPGDLLDGVIEHSHGDITTFLKSIEDARALARNRSGDSLRDALVRQDTINFERSKQNYIEKLGMWVSKSSASVYYHRPQMDVRTVRNPEFTGEHVSGYAAGPNMVRYDDARRPSHLEIVTCIVEKPAFSLARKIILVAHMRASAGEDWCYVDDLAHSVFREELCGIARIDKTRFKLNVERVLDVQRRIDIHPTLFTYSESEGIIRVSDARFVDFLIRIGRDVLEEALEASDLSQGLRAAKDRRLVTATPTADEYEAWFEKLRRDLEGRKETWPWIARWSYVLQNGLALYREGEQVKPPGR